MRYKQVNFILKHLSEARQEANLIDTRLFHSVFTDYLSIMFPHNWEEKKVYIVKVLQRLLSFLCRRL